MTNSETRALQKIDPQGRQTPGGGQLVWIPPGYELAAEAPPAPKESHLWDYIWLVWRGRWLVMFAFLFCVGIAILMMLRATPIYVGAAKLNIGSQSPRIVEFQDSDRRDASGSVDFIETQMQLIRSRTLARKVVEKLGLYGSAATGENANSDSLKPTSPSLLSSVKSLVHEPNLNSTRQEPGDAADPWMANRVSAFLGALSVSRIRGTEIVIVSFLDPDPAVCARVANAVCDAYMDLNYETKTNSYEYASKWIEQKLYEVKASLEKSEEQLYEVGGGQEALSLAVNAEKSSAKFEEMNMSLAAAERELHSKQFQLDSLRKSPRPEDLSSSVPLSNARVDALSAELEKCEVEYDQALQQFGPEMPQVKILKAAKARLESQIANETKRNAEVTLAKAQYDYDQAMKKAQLEYDQARSQRDYFNESFGKEKERMLAVQQRLIRYNILKREAEVNKDLYNSLLQRSREVGVTSGLRAGNVSIAETAERPLRPTFPNTRRTVLMGGFLGLFLGIGLVFFREYMNTTVRGALDVQNFGGMATLGLLPHVAGHSENGEKIQPETISAEEPRSMFAENVRALRTSVQYSLAGHSPKSILVTSAMPAEGKTTVATNLSIALAQSGHRTVLIDTDLKKPAVHKFFDASRVNGLSEILTGKTNGNLSAHLLKTDIQNLYVLPSGARPPNPVDLLDSVVMRRLLITLAEHFDHVVLDCTPTLDPADAGVLFRHVDGVILVVKPGKTPRTALLRVNEKVRKFGGHILGVVLNDRKARLSTRYGYGYGYKGGGYGKEVAAME